MFDDFVDSFSYFPIFSSIFQKNEFSKKKSARKPSGLGVKIGFWGPPAAEKLMITAPYYSVRCREFILGYINFPTDKKNITHVQVFACFPRGRAFFLHGPVVM